MGRRFLALGLLVVLIGGFAVTSVRPVYACSAGPDFNPVTESEVIVAGRLTRWERAEDARINPPSFAFAPVRVMMTVDWMLKGSTSPQIAILDHASLINPDTMASREYQWAGAAGACGAFDFDPAGKYAIMGLRQNANGTYQPNRLQTFFIGDSPSGPEYDRALTRLVSLGPIRLPSAPPAALHAATPVPTSLPRTGAGIQPLNDRRAGWAVRGLAAVAVALVGTSLVMYQRCR